MKATKHSQGAVTYDPKLVCIGNVAPQQVSWLWPGRVPLGRLTLLVGRPGEGKSFLTAYMAAQVSLGANWPDGTPCPCGSAILMSAEDDPGDTLRPRLDALGADVQKIHYLEGVIRTDQSGPQEQAISLTDIEAIEKALQATPDCKLVIVDPIGSYLGSGTDAHRDNEVRAMLAPLADLARKYDAAVVLVAHRRKSTGSHADDLVLGSRAFTGIARSVLHLASDPNDGDRRLLVAGKNNLAQKPDGLAFKIDGQPARIEWEEDPVDMDATDLLMLEECRSGSPGPPPDELDRAKQWLPGKLASGPRPAKELFGSWRAEDGSERTLTRAKKELGVTHFRKENCSWWQLPAKCAKRPGGEELGKVGKVGTGDACSKGEVSDSQQFTDRQTGEGDPDFDRLMPASSENDSAEMQRSDAASAESRADWDSADPAGRIQVSTNAEMVQSRQADELADSSPSHDLDKTANSAKLAKLSNLEEPDHVDSSSEGIADEWGEL